MNSDFVRVLDNVIFSNSSYYFAGCEDPGNIATLTRSPNSGYRFGLGENVTYYCPQGMREVKGTKSRQCMTRNMWSGSPLVCELSMRITFFLSF